MEDRYLFKGKRLDNGEWVTGNLIQNPFFKGVRSWISSEQEDKTRLRSISRTQALWNSIEVDSSTICQCTGLKDKNGKLIWENDIVSYWDSYSTENGLAEPDCIVKVVWDDETISFQVTNRLSAESWEVLDDECSVVGNAIDNPELLEVGE